MSASDPNLTNSANPASATNVKKRTRYTSVACNECKRRKIKCNGERPCERCGNQGLDCVYESPNFQDSAEYRAMAARIEALQGQVEVLFGMVGEVKAEQERWARKGMGTGMKGDGIGSGNGSGKGKGEGEVQEAMGRVGDGGGGAGDRGGDGTEGKGEGGSSKATATMVMDVDVDVDVSRQDGRRHFEDGNFDRPAESIDPLMEISRGEAATLLGIYTQQIHVIYPVLNLHEVMWRMFKADSLQETINNSSNAGTNSTTTPGSQTGSHMPLSHLQQSTELLNDVSALIMKMAIALAAHVQDPDGGKACRIFGNVQQVLANQGWPPGWSTEGLTINANTGEQRVTVPVEAIVRGIRLRLLHAIWDFQHGEEMSALMSCREALRVHKSIGARVTNDPNASSKDADVVLRCGGGIYSTYWRWTVLIQPSPRFDSTIEISPPRRFEDGDKFDHDEDTAIGLPLFEFAKLCSISCFAFERSGQELSALMTTKPPWTKENAVEHVHRWQGNFATGLRSLACLRPGFLAGKSVEERTILSSIYLYAHFLRLVICQYKRAGATDRYQGPISELYDSARYAHESIAVLWNVHEAGKTWAAHNALYNRFLLNAVSWVYDLLQDGAIRLSEEVKTSFQRTLILMETYCRYWDKAQWLLDKLQESRKYGALT